MNTARIVILTAIAAAICVAPVYAQNRDPGQATVDEAWAGQASPDNSPSPARREEVRKKIEAIRIWRLTEELKLDETTSARLASILSSLDQQRKDIHREQMDRMRELRVLVQASKPDEAKLKTALDKIEHVHNTMQALRNKELASAREILTIEQQARFVLFQMEFMRDMRKMISGAHGNGQGMGPGRGIGPGRGRMQTP
jgi:Spy/CpxP family protein refolding chaperone